MLVLSRKAEQTIEVGADIEVTILKIKGNCVRVGIKAPQHVRILRSECVSEEGWDSGHLPSEETHGGRVAAV